MPMEKYRLAWAVASAALVLLASLVAAPTVRPIMPPAGPAVSDGPGLATDITGLPAGSTVRPLPPD